MNIPRPRLARYGVATLVVVAALLLRLSVEGLFGTTSRLLLFAPAVTIAAWYGGVAPGVFATLLAACLAAFFLMWGGAAGGPGSEDSASLVAFLFVGFVITYFTHRLRDAQARAELSAAQAQHEVAERKHTESALVDSRSRLQALFRNTQDALLIADDNGRFLDANPAACALTGWSYEELLSRSVLDITPLGEHEQERDLWRDFLENGEQRGEFTLRRKDGSTVDAEYVAVANIVRGIHLSTLRDITQRRREERAEKFLSEAAVVFASSLDYEATLASVATLAVPHLADWCAVDIADESGVPKRLAAAHARPERAKNVAIELQARDPSGLLASTGVPRVIRTGKSEFYPQITDEVVLAWSREAAPGQVDGRRLTSVLIVPLVARGRAVGAITFVTADSGRRYDEADLAVAEELARRAGVAIENAMLYREAQQANRLKDEFLATLSHELRTPLNAILGWSNMLKSGRLDAERSARALETIERNAQAQSQIIEDILDVSRIITGKLRLNARDVEVGPVIEAALDSVRPAAEAKHIQLEYVFDKSVGPVWGDVDRLQQVVWNLLSNAVKFTPPGGRVRIQLERVGAYVQIGVQDTGAGIRPDFLPHVFDRFAIVRHLVELHGGTVAAENVSDAQGARFTVALPLRGAPVAQLSGDLSLPALPQAPSHRPVPGSLANLRILIVDDETDARELMRLVLEEAGAKVAMAASSAEGLDQIRRQIPDVMLVDIGMPKEDGYDFLRRVRALSRDKGRQVPAVAVTAYAREQDRERAYAAGFHSHVAKPVMPPQLIQIIEDVAAAAHVRGRQI
jgi:PAS domain S-box-containing protein